MRRLLSRTVVTAVASAVSVSHYAGLVGTTLPPPASTASLRYCSSTAASSGAVALSTSASPTAATSKPPRAGAPSSAAVASASPSATVVDPVGGSDGGLLIRRLAKHDFDDIDRVARAYGEYFNHMRFRQGWSKPKFSEEEVSGLFREAAEYAVRIRKLLDEKTPNTPKLRMVDGAAQTFLHSDRVPDIKADGHKFARELVHATFQDALGYVEGLNRKEVDALLSALIDHRYNPSVHVMHLLREAADLAHRAAPPLHRVEEGSEEDKQWRDAIKHMYASVDLIEKVSKTVAQQHPPPAGSAASSSSTSA